jgi:hypothetical protein
MILPVIEPLLILAPSPRQSGKELNRCVANHF